MTGRHEQAVAPEAAEADVGTALRETNEADRLAGPSLPALPLAHADHRDVRAGSASSPSPFRAGDRHRNEFVIIGYRCHHRPLSRWLLPATMAHGRYALSECHLLRNH